MVAKMQLKESLVQRRISPLWTRILSRAGYADRNVLAAALKHLEISRAESVLKSIKSNVIEKARIDTKALSEETLKQPETARAGSAIRSIIENGIPEAQIRTADPTDAAVSDQPEALRMDSAVARLKENGILKARYNPSSMKDIEPWMLKAVTVHQVEAALNGIDPVLANTEKISGILAAIGNAKGLFDPGLSQKESVVKTQQEALDVADRVIPGAKGIFSKLKSLVDPSSLFALSLQLMAPASAFAEDPAGAMQLGDVALQNSFFVAAGLKVLAKIFLPVPRTGQGFYYNFRNLLNNTLTNMVITCGTGFVLGGEPVLYVLAGLGMTAISHAMHIAKAKADKVREENAKKPQIFETHCNFLNKKFWPYDAHDVSGETRVVLSEAAQKMKLLLTEGRMNVRYENAKDVAISLAKGPVKLPKYILNVLEELADPTMAKTTAWVQVALGTLFAYFVLRCTGTAAIISVPNITLTEIGIGLGGAFVLAFGEFNRLITSGVFMKDQDLARRQSLADYAAPTLRLELESRGLYTDYVVEKIKRHAQAQGVEVGVYVNKKLAPEEIRRVINDLMRDDILPYSGIGEGPRLTSRRIAAYEDGGTDKVTAEILKEMGIGEDHPLFNTFGMIGAVIESGFLMNNKLRDQFIVIGRPLMQGGRTAQNVSENSIYKEAIDQMLRWMEGLKKNADASFMRAEAAGNAQDKIGILEELITSTIKKYRERYETWKAIAEEKWRRSEYSSLDFQDTVKTWEWHIKDWEKRLETVRSWRGAAAEQGTLTRIKNAFDFIRDTFSRDALLIQQNEYNHIDQSVYESIKDSAKKNPVLAGIELSQKVSPELKQRLLKALEEEISKYDVQDRKRIGKARAIISELGELADKAAADGWTVEDYLGKAAFEASAQFNAEAGLKAGAESFSDERFGKTYVRVSMHSRNRVDQPPVKRNRRADILRGASQQAGEQPCQFFEKVKQFAAKENNPDVTLNKDGSVSVPRYVELSKEQFIKLAADYLYKDEKAEHDRLITLLQSALNDRLIESSSNKVIAGIIANTGLDPSKLFDRRKIRSLERLRKDFLNPVDTRTENELLSIGLAIALSSREIEWIPWTPQQKKDQSIYVAHMDKDYRYYSKNLQTGEDFDILNRGLAAYGKWEYEGSVNISQIQFSQENAAAEHIGPEAREGVDYPKDHKFENGKTYKFAKGSSGQSLISLGGRIYLYSNEVRDALSFGQNVDQSPWYGAFVTTVERQFLGRLNNDLIKNKPVTVADFMAKLFAMADFRELFVDTYSDSSIDHLQENIVNEMRDRFGGNVFDRSLTKDTGEALIEMIKQNMIETAKAVGIMPGRNLIAANICCGTPRLVRHTITQIGYTNYYIPDESGRIIGRVRTSFGKSERSRNSGDWLPPRDPRATYDGKEKTGSHELFSYEPRWYAYGGGPMPDGSINKRHMALQLNKTRSLSKADIARLSASFEAKGQVISLDGDKIIVRDKKSGRLTGKFWWYHPDIPEDQNEKKMKDVLKKLEGYKKIGHTISYDGSTVMVKDKDGKVIDTLKYDLDVKEDSSFLLRALSTLGVKEDASVNAKKIIVSKESNETFEGLGFVQETFETDENGNDVQIIRHYLPVNCQAISQENLPQTNYYETRAAEEIVTESFIVGKDYVDKAKIDLGRIANVRFEEEVIPGTEDVRLIRHITIPRVELTHVHASGKAEKINPVIETTPFTTITEDMEGTINQKMGGTIVKAYNIVVGRGEGPLDLSMMLPQQDRWALGGMQVFLLSKPDLIKNPTLLFSKEGLRRIASFLYYPHGFFDQALRIVPLAFFTIGMMLPKGLMLFSTDPMFMAWLAFYLGSSIGVYAPNVYRAMKRTTAADSVKTVLGKEAMSKVFGVVWSRASLHSLMMDAKGFAITMATSSQDRKMAPLYAIDGWRTRYWMSGLAMGMGIAMYADKVFSLGVANPFDSFAIIVNTFFPTLDFLLLRAGLDKYYGGVVKVEDDKKNVLGFVRVGGLAYLGYDRKIQEMNEEIKSLGAQVGWLERLYRTVQQANGSSDELKNLKVKIRKMDAKMVLLNRKKQALEGQRNSKVGAEADKIAKPGIVKRTLKKAPVIGKLFRGQLDVDNEVK